MMKMKMMIGNRRNGIKRTNNKVYFIRVQFARAMVMERETYTREVKEAKKFRQNLVELQE